MCHDLLIEKYLREINPKIIEFNAKGEKKQKNILRL